MYLTALGSLNTVCIVWVRAGAQRLAEEEPPWARTVSGALHEVLLSTTTRNVVCAGVDILVITIFFANTEIFICWRNTDTV